MKFKIGDKVRRIEYGMDDYRCCADSFPKGYIGEVVGFGAGNNTIQVPFSSLKYSLRTKAKYWELVRENEIKVDTVMLEFIRADNGHRWFVQGEKGDYMLQGPRGTSIESLHKYLVQFGHIAPNPLQKAMNKLTEECIFPPEKNTLTITLEKAREIVRTLYEEAMRQ